MSINFSKSKYCKGVQCPKMLWLDYNKHDKFEQSVMNQRVLDNGNMVGDLAMGLFGDYIEIPFGELSEMIKETSRLIECGTPIITEASFAYNDNFCSVDILINAGNREVEIYEVKSSTEVKEIHIHDMTYQTYILNAVGYKVRKASLVYINNEYIRHGKLELEKLFKVEDITDIVYKMQDGVAKNIARIRTIADAGKEPGVDISEACFKPYECGYWKYCTECLSKPNVFDLHGIQKRTAFKNYVKGIVSYDDILSAKNTVNEKALMQIDCERNNLKPHINHKNIEKLMEELSYPLYFLDFESIQPAIPLYDDSKPYGQIPFQYSLHYIERENGELMHTEYLAEPGEDPRRKLAERLCEDIPTNVCVLAYNMSFEKGRIKEMADIYPDLAEHLINIYNNIKDLMIPFRNRDYYVREMHGSYSIKYVLPALFPNDPDMNYNNLEDVHNGTEASDTFMEMSNMEKEEMMRARENLLKYCKLDTYAMVKIWMKLKEAIQCEF